MRNFLTTKEVADMLEVTASTVTNVLITQKNDPLPAFKFGGSYKFMEKKVKEWIERQAINK